VSEWIAAEGYRRTSWDFKQLFLNCSCSDRALQYFPELIDMKVDMNWSPVTLVSPRGIWSWARTGVSTLGKKQELRAFCTKDRDTRVRLRDHLKSEDGPVEAQALCEAGNIDAY